MPLGCFKRAQRRPATKTHCTWAAVGSAVRVVVVAQDALLRDVSLRSALAEAATRFSRVQGPLTKDDEYNAV